MAPSPQESVRGGRRGGILRLHHHSPVDEHSTVRPDAVGVEHLPGQRGVEGGAGAVGVVLAARGYPGSPVKGCVIGLPPAPDGVHVIHAGTALDDRGRLVSVGGRVLVVVATGADIADARERAYAHIARIDFTDGFARSDIASQARLDAIAARLG